MLTGSQSQEVMNAGLNRLTTYGILKDEGAAFLNELFPALIDGGLSLIHISEPTRPY